MHFQTIVAVLSVVVAAIAAPSAIVKRTTGPEAQQQCGNDLEVKCCNKVEKVLFSLISLVPIQLGFDCSPIDVLSLVDITEQCSNTVVCCESGNQVSEVKDIYPDPALRCSIN
ncbi:MAG: hypothetical protein M1815_002768 [Lichina confinis]|nr:MAG: hypothetical protein M1815_002768 [Lichina confinis]